MITAERKPLDEIVALIADTLLSRADTVRINGADVPKARVAERFGDGALRPASLLERRTPRVSGDSPGTLE